MSIVSLEKFLYDPRRPAGPAAATDPAGSYLELSSRLMAAICRSVLVGGTFTDLSGKLDELRKNLSVAGERDASGTAHETESLLQTFQQRVRQTDEETAKEFKGVLDILNNAFGQLNARSEKSDERMKHLEAGLNHVAKVDDLGSLRAQVGKMLEFVRQEVKFDQTNGKAEIDSLGSQIRQIQQSTSRFRAPFATREEAIDALKSRLDSGKDANLHTALFVADSLRAVRVRHGDEVANNILQDLACNPIQSLAPEGAVFCWSPTSILLIWDHADVASAPGELAGRIKPPVECKAFVGTRTALFNIGLRSTVRAANGPIDEIVWALDRFQKGGSA
ncbi:MAG TPA: hypothetical protein VH351_09630 [Bryobacteraceae bacterium]|jgi:hypothetical protein|nr:hypothetical protein [Bryobacteraceae bacterium]